MINISAVTKNHSRPYFMTPKRKAHLAKMRAIRQSGRVSIKDADIELERLGRIVSYEPKS